MPVPPYLIANELAVAIKVLESAHGNIQITPRGYDIPRIQQSNLNGVCAYLHTVRVNVPADQNLS